ncbi:MAG: TolB family protein [Vicinamibacterales bacterium]
MRSVVLLLAAGFALQQAPPPTEVYLASAGRDYTPSITNAVDISNNPGYDNQPSFTPDGKAILFTSNRDGKQTDIYRYDIVTKALTQLTNTPEGEYSPLVTPDGRTFSVIRAELDGTQRLWRFDVDGSNPRLVFENIKPVGYQAWIDATHVAMFILGANGQPATLQVGDTTTGEATTIESRIGRALQIRPGRRTLTFVVKPQSGPWLIKEWDPSTRQATTICETLEGSEDFTWDPVFRDGRLLMAKGSKIFRWDAASGWREEGDFSAAGVDSITRLAVSPDARAGSANRLAFVGVPRR